MDDPNDITDFPDTECSLTPVVPESEVGEPKMPPIPQHAVEAAAAFTAEFDELLAHLAAHPAERWVAYHGRQRLGFSADHLGLYQECLKQFPDRQFCVYGIDPCDKNLEVAIN